VKKILISLKEDGKNGGPFNSHLRIMMSSLAEKYEFVPLLIPKGRLRLINPKLTMNLIRQIRYHRPDLVHFAGMELIGFHVALACKLSGQKNTLMAIHGSASESLALKRTIFKGKFLTLLEYLTVKWTKYCYGVSDYVSGWSRVRAFPGHCFGTIYNIVALGGNELQLKNDIRQELGIASNKIVAVTIGRIEVEKGFDVLREVIKNDTNVELVYLIVGEGAYLAEMKGHLKLQEAEGKVYFLGYRADVTHILQGSDIFVTASYHETLCMALAEAGLNGLALIAAKVGGMPEIIVHEECGFLIPSHNPCDYNEKIDNLVKNKALLSEMKRRAKLLVGEKFKIESIESKLDSVYQHIFLKS